jgi:hypothetical protein
MPLPRVGLYLGLRIVANVIAALVIILLILDPACDLTPIVALLAVAVALCVGPVLWPTLVK